MLNEIIVAILQPPSVCSTHGQQQNIYVAATYQSKAICRCTQLSERSTEIVIWYKFVMLFEVQCKLFPKYFSL